MHAAFNPFVRIAAVAGVLLAGSSIVVGAAPATAAPATTVAAPTAPTQFADDGLGLEGTSTYTVDPPGGAIHVAVDMLATNLVPPSHGYYVISYAYFAQIGVPVLAEATNLAAATADGTPLTVTIEAEPESPVSFAVIDLADNLEYQETHQLRLTYELPDQGPRAPGITRVNPAYTAVVPLPVGDPGHAAVRVVVPEDMVVEQLGSSTMQREPSDGSATYAASAIADPIAWDATLVARDVRALDRVELDGPHDVEVRSWPGDVEWSDFVVEHVTDGLPILEELIGQDWPVQRTLRIDETVSPYLYGYAGWYDTTAETIEIGDELDPIVVLHELSHAWFNRDLFTERWINEGLAEVFAARTLERMGEPLPQPDPVSTADPGFIRLADWSSPMLSSSVSDDQERYGYNAAFALVGVLYQELGAEGLARVIDAAAEDRIAYQGDPDPEEQDGGVNGWRRFLDLLEEVGGSTQADLQFRTFVVPDVELPVLDVRAATRASYAALETAGAGWTAPLAVREAMSDWDFRTANETMTHAQSILAVRDQIAAAIEPLGLAAPAGLEAAYEAADRADLTGVLADANALLAVVDELAAAHDAVEADHDPWSRIGLLGGGADDAYGAAVDAFVDNDADAVLAEAAATHDVIARADDRGRAAIIAAALILLVGWAVRRTGRPGQTDRTGPAGARAPGTPRLGG